MLFSPPASARSLSIPMAHWILAASLCCLSAKAQRQQGAVIGPTLSGSVLDPHGKRVSGADVQVTCGAKAVHTTTNSAGEFELRPNAGRERCALAVAADGFAPYRRTVNQGLTSIQVKLRLAMVYETVTVKATGETAAGEGSLDTVTLAANELRKLSNDSQDFIRYAELLAGTAPGPHSLYVDGLPAASMPPAEMIAGISINQDPFSAEFADGDNERIEVTTRAPDRKLRFSLAGNALALGGNSPLGAGLHSSSSFGAPVVSGPIPGLPLAFSAHGTYASVWSDQALQAETNGVPAGISSVQSGGDAWSGFLGLYYVRRQNLHASASLAQSESRSANQGAGGLVLAESAGGSIFRTSDFRGSFEGSADRWIWRSAVSLRSTRSVMQANDEEPGIDVLGYFTSGGAPIEFRSAGKTVWVSKITAAPRLPRHAWEWGAIISHSRDDDTQTPNPAGQMKFSDYQDYEAALAGAPIGTWLAYSGGASASFGNLGFSPFVQGELWTAKNAVLRGGLRGDFQSQAGWALSPRVSAVARLRGVLFHGGAGVFVHPWPDSVHLVPLLASRMGPTITTGVALPGGQPAISSGSRAAVATEVDPDLERPRAVITKAGLELPWKAFIPGFDATWNSARHFSGSERMPDGIDWIDVISSNRNLRRFDLHAQLRSTWKGQSLTGNFTWTHAQDDTDGPFSYAEYYNNVRADWARSTGIPARSASLVGQVNLPWHAAMIITGSRESSSPFNTITGNDLNGNGLFNDRGGLARNSGNGPGFRDLSLFASRPLRIPRIGKSSDRNLAADLGVQVANLLNNRDYQEPEPVETSPLFGQPLEALPGRSARFSLTLAR